MLTNTHSSQEHDVQSFDVLVITVNWNGGELLGKCLQALHEQTYQSFGIYVVDNNSSDSSMDCVADYPDVIFDRLDDNYGFAKANNYAVNKFQSKYVVLLNPDAFPDPDWLERLVDEADRNPDYASFASRQMIYEQDSMMDGAGDVYHISGLMWRSGYKKQISEKFMIRREVFSPCAGAALYRRDAFLAVGGFDEDYFCYVEDVDLGFRMRLAGYRSLYVPDAVVHHVGSATTGGQHSDFSVYHGHRNLVWTYFKNMPGIFFWLFLPLHIALNVATVVYFSIHGQAAVILKSKWDAVKFLPKILKKRKVIQRNRHVNLNNLYQLFDKSPF